MSETTIEYAPESKLTRQQAADWLDISLSRLAQHRRAGLIDHAKHPVKRHTRFVFRDLVQLARWRAGEITEDELRAYIDGRRDDLARPEVWL